jgi:hypothetical protein
MYPHRIRLRGPWDYEPLRCAGTAALPPAGRMTLPCRWSEGSLADFSGSVRFRRRFGYPGRLDAWECVWLTFAGITGRAEVTLNEARLGVCAEGPCEYEVTALLQPRNELVVEVGAEGPCASAGPALLQPRNALVGEVTGPTDGGLWGEVALEVRCTAFLRGVRFWAEGDELHVAGEVAGTAGGPLDLYLLCGRATVAYASVAPAAEGRPFHLSAAGARPGEDGGAQVDLVSGPIVWYTVRWEPAPRPAPPAGS